MIMGRVWLIFIWALFTCAPAAGQQALRVRIIDDYGAVSLSKEGIGCFDPLAAIRLHDEVAQGKVSDATKQSFAVGSCIIVKQGVQLAKAQKVLINDNSFMRGDILNTAITIYFPKGLMQFESETNIDRVGEFDSLRTTAEDLRRRVGEMEICSQEGAALNSRILAFNQRASEYETDRKESTAGSRFGGGGLSPTQEVTLPAAQYQRLYREGIALETQVTEYWEKCSPYQDGIDLDKDYMEYYRSVMGDKNS